MEIIYIFIIFCSVLFIYLHIQFHLKTSDDLEMYEIDNPSKNKLEEICDIRQPVLFTFDCDKIIDTSNKQFIQTNYPAFEVKIRNTKEKQLDADPYVLLPIHTAEKLFQEDKDSLYFTENNSDFLQETGLVKSFKYNDEFLRPYMVSNCNYDVLIGSSKTCTPFRYEINYRNYLLVTQGSARIKLAPPNSIKYLYPIYDYENFEFRSPIDPWKPQAKFKADFNKVKCLEFTLDLGKTLFIPAYWWYSIEFDTNTSISCFNYRTYMNNIAISQYVFLHSLQIQNVKRNIVKKMDINELSTTDNKDNNISKDDKDDKDDKHNKIVTFVDDELYSGINNALKNNVNVNVNNNNNNVLKNIVDNLERIEPVENIQDIN
jgi:hypothetical protein